MTNAIYLDPTLVPAALRGDYQGKKFKAVVTTEVTIPADAGLWSGGTQDTYSIVELESGRTIGVPCHQNESPWGHRSEFNLAVKPGFVVVNSSVFCGKDMGLTFYVHPDNANKLLPAPCAELSEHEFIVLQATCSYKSSYGGMDRYQMARRDVEYSWKEQKAPFPTREQWQAAKDSLIGKGLLNKAGAVTPKGRNARPSRY